MNLLLLENTDFIQENTAIINDFRAQHVLQILKKGLGDSLIVGLLNHTIGSATITAINPPSLTLQVQLDQAPPPALPLTVILALPRPLMLKRILANIAEIGIKELHLIHSQKVEKSYWQSPLLNSPALLEPLKLGLMQAKDTILPTVYQHRHFKPFIDKHLASIIGQQAAFIAHPYSNAPCPSPSPEPRVIIIGPEGGFNDFEVQQFEKHGVQAFHLGTRIYKVETAVTILSVLLSTIG